MKSKCALGKVRYNIIGIYRVVPVNLHVRIISVASNRRARILGQDAYAINVIYGNLMQ